MRLIVYMGTWKKGRWIRETGQTVKWTVPSDLKMAATVTVSVNDGVNESVYSKSKRLPIRSQKQCPCLLRKLLFQMRVHAVSSVAA